MTEDDRQLILSGSLDFFFRNKDYLGILRQIETRLGCRFKLASCLDVGLAAGVTLRKDEDNLYKPSEPSFHDKQGNLDLGSIHTSGVFLIQTGV